MMGAVDFGHHALVEWLLARGANVNARVDRSVAAYGFALGRVERRLADGASAR